VRWMTWRAISARPYRSAGVTPAAAAAAVAACSPVVYPCTSGRGGVGDAEVQGVPLAVRALEALYGSDRLEPSGHHDAHAVAQRLALLHGVCGEHQAAALGVPAQP
jgi:hypothetical protein